MVRQGRQFPHAFARVAIIRSQVAQQRHRRKGEEEGIPVARIVTGFREGLPDGGEPLSGQLRENEVERGRAAHRVER
jgi:hypothetical protein